MPEKTSEEKVIVTACSSHCGGECLLRVHLRDGVIVRIETDGGEEPQLRACLRCRAYRQRVYDPDRLKFPMRRVGKRGEGKFERISWDEALDTVANEFMRVRDTYGPSATFLLKGGGDAVKLHRADIIEGLLTTAGGCTACWGVASLEAGLYAEVATYGAVASANDHNDLLNSRLIIMWGWNPAVTIHECNTSWYLIQAKESGAKIISVDPRHTDSTATLASQWIPIIPGTDTAMLIAMAYVIIKENLHDQSFLDTYTVGFTQFRDYVLGAEDGLPKTPAWAEGITGVSANIIENLAREYATTKPAALKLAYGPGRTAYGEQYFRAANTLMAMTGNVHVSTRALSRQDMPMRHGFGKGRNPFDYEPGTAPPVGEGDANRYQTRDESQSSRMGSSLDPDLKSRRRVLQGKMYDAILQGKAGGYPSDIKMAWANCGNTLNQLPNTNKGVRAFKQLEFIVVSEQFMTPTAKFADILLPAATSLERNAIYRGGATLFYANKAIEPMFESKTDFNICSELAPRLGIDDYSDKTEDEWLRWEVTGPGMEEHIPDYDAFKKQGVYRVPSSSPPTEDPRERSFPTPSGKIEIYSQTIADLNDPKIPPIPKYMETWESRNDPLTRKYPLQLITTHHKLRAHGNFDNVPWLKDLEPQRVSINAADAETRGIRDGEEVRIFNDRGEIIIPSFVTETIMPGVVNISEGAWYNPDSQGIDRGGCPNVLTKDEHSPAGAGGTPTPPGQVPKV